MLAISPAEGCALLTFAALSGSAFLFTAKAKSDFPAVSLAALRLGIGSLGLCVLGAAATLARRCHERVRARAPSSPPWLLDLGAAMAWPAAPPREWLRPLAAVGLLNTALPYSLYAVAFDNGVEVGAAAVFSGAAPLLSALLAACMLLPHASTAAEEPLPRAGLASPVAGEHAAAEVKVVTTPMHMQSSSDGIYEDDDDDAADVSPLISMPGGPRGARPATATGAATAAWSPTAQARRASAGSSSGRFGAPLGGTALAARAAKRSKPLVYAGLLVGFVGIVLLSVEKIAHPHPHNQSSHVACGGAYGAASDGPSLSSAVLGHCALLVAVASKATASVLAERHLRAVPLFALALGQTVLGFAFALVAALAVDFAYHFGAGPPACAYFGFVAEATPGAWYAVAYLGLCSSCIVYLLQYFLIKRVGAVKQMLVDYLTPVVGIVEGAIFRNELAGLAAGIVAAEVGGVLLVGVGVSMVTGVWDTHCRRRGNARRR